MPSINACKRLKGECWCSFAVRLGGYLAVTIMTAALSADECCVCWGSDVAALNRLVMFNACDRTACGLSLSCCRCKKVCCVKLVSSH